MPTLPSLQGCAAIQSTMAPPSSTNPWLIRSFQPKDAPVPRMSAATYA